MRRRRVAPVFEWAGGCRAFNAGLDAYQRHLSDLTVAALVGDEDLDRVALDAELADARSAAELMIVKARMFVDVVQLLEQKVEAA
jgi:hypothetical protein